MDVPFDASDAEHMTTLEGLCTLRDHGVLAVAAVCMVVEATELLAVRFNDTVHEQDLNKDLTVLCSEVVVQVAFGLVVCPGKFTEPVEALEMEWWNFLAGMACACGMDSVVLCHVFIGWEAGRWGCLVAGEVNVVASWVHWDSGFGHDSEWVGERE